ncbi:HIT family protein [Candidatus Woesearchaeota archaeon]|nr:HIT family protein [Candidatus Woesearchaeota archaeon]
MTAPLSSPANAEERDCIFCQIVEEKASAKKVYEDEKCLAILDINPANPGHVLVISKNHYDIMQLATDDDVGHMFNVAKQISKAQIRSLNADGSNIQVASGVAAGQKSKHFTIHVVPRKRGDGLRSYDLPKNQIGPEDQEKLRQAIISKVDEYLHKGSD